MLRDCKLSKNFLHGTVVFSLHLCCNRHSSKAFFCVFGDLA